ncbi:MAG: hypothetical protein ACOCSE_03755 [Chitinivibrionales bacterium]
MEKKFDIYITSFPENMAGILKFRLSKSRNISLKEAEAMLNKRPLLYATGADLNSLKREAGWMKNSDIRFTAKEYSDTPQDQAQAKTGPDLQDKPEPEEPSAKGFPEDQKTKGLDYTETLKGARSGRTGSSIHTPPLKEKSEKPDIRSILAVLLITGTIGLTVFLIMQGDKKEYKFNSSEKPVKSESGDKSEKTAPGQKKEDQGKQSRRKSSGYIDSASGTSDMEKRIKFYKIAISFNRMNLKAWLGLIDAYKESERKRKAVEMKARAEEIFGENLTEVNTLISYTSTLDKYMEREKKTRIRILTSLQTEEGQLREVWSVSRLLRNRGNNTTITIISENQETGKGVLTTLRKGNHPESFEEFRDTAEKDLLN